MSRRMVRIQPHSAKNNPQPSSTRPPSTALRCARFPRFAPVIAAGRRSGEVGIYVLDHRDDVDERLEHEEIHERADDRGDLVAHQDADADADHGEDGDHDDVAEHREQHTVVDVQPMVTPSAANQGVMIAAVSAAHASP